MKYTTICIVTILFLVFSTVSSGLSKEKRVYKIGTIPWAGWSALQVAQKKGFWKELGVDVEIKYFAEGTTMHEAIFTQQVDFAMNMVGTAVNWYFQIEPVTVLAETNWSHGGDKLIIKQGLSLEDLKGKPIGVYSKSIGLFYFLETYLNQKNLSVSDFKLVRMLPKDLVEQFIVDRLSALMVFDPLALKAQSKGNGKVLITSADIERSIPECIYTFSTHLEKMKEDDVIKILAGVVKGANWLNNPDNEREYFKILNDETFKDDPPYSDEQLKGMVSSVKIHNATGLCLANRNNEGIFDYFDNVNQMIKEGKILQKQIEPDKFFDNRYLMKALELIGNTCR